MKNTLKILGIIALVALVMFSVAACKKDKDKAADSVPVVSELDAIIDQLDTIAGEILDLRAKTAAGDTEANNAIPAAIEKLEAAESQLKGREDDLSEAQAKKYLDILAKLEENN